MELFKLISVIVILLRPCLGKYFHLAKDCLLEIPQNKVERCVIDVTRRNLRQKCFLAKKNSKSNCKILKKDLRFYRSYNICPKSYKCEYYESPESQETVTLIENTENSLLPPSTGGSESTESQFEETTLQSPKSSKELEVTASSAKTGSTLISANEDDSSFTTSPFESSGDSMSVDVYTTSSVTISTSGVTTELITTVEIAGDYQSYDVVTETTSSVYLTNPYDIEQTSSTYVYSTSDPNPGETGASGSTGAKKSTGETGKTGSHGVVKTNKTVPALIASFSTFVILGCVITCLVKLKSYFSKKPISGSQFELTAKTN